MKLVLMFKATDNAGVGLMLDDGTIITPKHPTWNDQLVDFKYMCFLGWYTMPTWAKNINLTTY